MQYMLMCCFDEDTWNRLPNRQRDQIMADYGNWLQNLVDSGYFRGGAKLCAPASATTLRIKSGSMVLTDGPFAETKEQLGGYHLVECRDLNEAIAVAARIPTLPAGGVVEVRQIDHFES